mmetsp:Transcript_46637/g.117475  ORF Transcript_46637/g.117475 Transcript_46637/m.117475 type:complete len:249 (+) Transcript_46637:495-1241(+)
MHKEVHGAHLRDLVLRAVDPQNLRVPHLCCLLLRQDGRAVVRANFVVPSTAREGAHMRLVCVQLHWLEVLVVGTHRRADDVQQRVACRGHAQPWRCGNQGRPNVQGVVGEGRDPIPLESDQLLDEGEQRGLVERREGQAGGRVVEALHIHVGAEEARVALAVLVCLHALKALQSVVQAGDSGVQAEVLEGVDAGGCPAVLCCPRNGQHVISELVAEDEPLRLWLRPRLSGLLHHKIRCREGGDAARGR